MEESNSPTSIVKSDKSKSSGQKDSKSKNSNEQFDQYTSEIYNGLKNFASDLDRSNEAQLFQFEPVALPRKQIIENK